MWIRDRLGEERSIEWETLCDVGDMVTLEVRESNLAARSLYDSMGFVLAATRPGYYTDPPEGALIYWRGDDQHDPSLSR